MIYLACPYWHDDQAVRAARVDAATEYAAALADKGIHVFSPLTYTARLAEMTRETTEAYWLDLVVKILPTCDELHVLRLDGWSRSHGVARERNIAHLLGIPEVLVDLEEEE